ncbi:MAG: adenosine deaminase family protein [Myxococcales bacterium]|nr:adenosine deaminase family protein [Myxococcales bacterium]
MRGLVDLHRHLDGSLRRSTVDTFAADLGLDVPVQLPFTPHMGLHAALSRFAFTCSLLQTTGALAQVASEMCEDAQTEGISTLEVRFAPQLHGMALAGAVDAVLEGLGGRAGLILCGLYGDPPALVDALVDLAAARPGVVGLDLAGGPASGHDFRLEDYADAFRRAATLGLGRTVHAGEGRPPAEIRTAIDILGAQRIGHGTTLLDDPTVCDLVLQRGITIEACPTSNWHTGIITDVAAHPLPQWLALGIKCTVNTDNTLLSAVTLPEEIARVRGIDGVGDAEIAQLTANGHAARFS